MRIGFDGKRAIRNTTGLGNYSRSTIQLLAEQYPEHEYHVYSPIYKSHPRTAFIDRLKNILVHIPKRYSIFWRSWGMTQRLKEDKINVYHGLSHELPMNIQGSGIPSVVTIHDLIFMRFPEYFNAIDRFIYYLKFSSACKNANHIIAISEQTKRDIIKYFKIASEKISVVYQSCDKAFSIPVAEEKKKEVRKKYQLPATYILSVGTIEPRKNLLLAIKALKSIESNVSLVAVGRKTTYYNELISYIKANHLEARVHFLEQVDFNDLPAIYQQAELLVYPSRFEGFGIPIIEALNSRIPVIGATGSCLEEAGGPGSLYTNPDNENELAELINKVLADQELKSKMISDGNNYVRNFEQANVAPQLMNIYKHLAK